MSFVVALCDDRRADTGGRPRLRDRPALTSLDRVADDGGVCFDHVMSIRTARVAEEIQKVLGERLVRGLRDPLPGFVTIRGVEVTSDFTHAKVFVSVFGSDAQKKAAIDGLMAQRGFLRGEVGKNVRLRHTPTLSFILDESAERAARVHALLDEVRAHGTVKTLEVPAESKTIADARAVVAAQPDVRQAQVATPKPVPTPPAPRKPTPPAAKKPAAVEAAPVTKKPFAALASFAAYVAEPAVEVKPVVVDEEATKTAAKKPAAKKPAAKKPAAKKPAAKKPAAKKVAKKATKKPAAKKVAKKATKKVAKKATKKPTAKKPAAKKPAAKKVAKKATTTKAAKKPAAKKVAKKAATKKAGR